MGILRLVSVVVWIAVFLVVLLFAIRNADPVTLHLYSDVAWHPPLVVLLLASFAAGAVFGVLACLPALVRRQRRLAALRKELGLRRPEPSAPAAAPERAAADLPLLP